MATKTNSWVMNDTQKSFVNALSKYENGATLLDIKLDTGVEFKTGSINTLISKGVVSAETEKQYACDIVYDNKVIGHTTKTLKVYKLVK